MRKIIISVFCFMFISCNAFAANLTGQRQFYKRYENNTGQTLFVSCVVSIRPNSLGSVRGYVDGYPVAIESMISADPYIWEYRTINMVVPNGGIYWVMAGNPNVMSIKFWGEQ